MPNTLVKKMVHDQPLVLGNKSSLNHNCPVVLSSGHVSRPKDGLEQVETLKEDSEKQGSNVLCSLHTA